MSSSLILLGWKWIDLPFFLLFFSYITWKGSEESFRRCGSEICSKEKLQNKTCRHIVPLSMSTTYHVRHARLSLAVVWKNNIEVFVQVMGVVPFKSMGPRLTTMGLQVLAPLFLNWFMYGLKLNLFLYNTKKNFPRY